MNFKGYGNKIKNAAKSVTNIPSKAAIGINKKQNPEYFGTEYGGVEVTYFPMDPFSGLYLLDNVIRQNTWPHKTWASANAAKMATDTFISEAQQNFTKVGLHSTGDFYHGEDMYNSFFGKISDDGDLILGNSAVNPRSGEPYPTHLEYGYNVKGVRVGPYNVMRPAVAKAIEVYKENISDNVMKQFLMEELLSSTRVYASLTETHSPTVGKDITVNPGHFSTKDFFTGQEYSSRTYGPRQSHFPAK